MKKTYVQESNKSRNRLNGKKIGNWKSYFKCGTWNDRILYKAREMKELMEDIERYKIKRLALQYVKLEDVGTTKMS